MLVKRYSKTKLIDLIERQNNLYKYFGFFGLISFVLGYVWSSNMFFLTIIFLIMHLTIIFLIMQITNELKLKMNILKNMEEQKCQKKNRKKRK